MFTVTCVIQSLLVVILVGYRLFAYITINLSHLSAQCVLSCFLKTISVQDITSLLINIIKEERPEKTTFVDCECCYFRTMHFNERQVFCYAVNVNTDCFHALFPGDSFSEIDDYGLCLCMLYVSI